MVLNELKIVMMCNLQFTVPHVTLISVNLGYKKFKDLGYALNKQTKTQITINRVSYKK